MSKFIVIDWYNPDIPVMVVDEDDGLPLILDTLEEALEQASYCQAGQVVERDLGL